MTSSESEEREPSGQEADAQPGAPSGNRFRLAQRGIELCRRDDWRGGASYLKAVFESPGDGAALPECFYSYLGCCLAGLEGRRKEGLKLCRKAIELEFYQPDNYLNLARIYAAVGAGRQVMRAVNDGLKMDPEHRELLELQREYYTRRGAVLGFLPRRHSLNLLLGKLRHRLVGDLQEE